VADDIVTIETQAGITLAKVEAKQLNEDLTRKLEALVREAAAAEREAPLVMDLGAVEFMPSVSLGALVTISLDCKQNNQRFMLVGLQPTLREALSLTRLDKLFEIQDTVAAALEQVKLDAAG